MHAPRELTLGLSSGVQPCSAPFHGNDEQSVFTAGVRDFEFLCENDAIDTV